VIAAGDAIPDVEIKQPGANGMPESVKTGELFAKGRTVLFGVPGAFTPGCDKIHLPGFVEQADDLFAKGVDRVACVAVNDAFVMDAWGKAHGVGDKIVMLADGNGDFTKALGLELNASKFGMGSRSQRYSLIANDGVVEQLNIEAAGEFRVSSADYLLEHL